MVARIARAAAAMALLVLVISCPGRLIPATGPSVLGCSITESAGVLLSSSVTITFSASMDAIATEGAFSSSPAIVGTFQWNTDTTEVTLDPSGLLQGSTDYAIAVSTAARDLGGNTLQEEFTLSFSTVAELTAPQNVSITRGTGELTLSWDEVAGADTYNVYWSTASGRGKGGTKIAAASSPYTHTGLVDGVSYYYVVCAQNGDGEGPLSGEVTTAPGGVLPGPSEVAAVAGNGQVTVSWHAVAGVTGYNIYWSTESGEGKEGTRIDDVTSPYAHTGRQNGVTYHYVVVACDENGEGLCSAEVAATLPVLAAPQNVQAVAGDEVIDLSWDAVESADSYVVYWSIVAGTGTGGTAIQVEIGTSLEHVGLTNWQTYHYVVVAVNLGGTSAPSSETSGEPYLGVRTPSGVVAEAGLGEVTVSWLPVAGAAGYNLYWSTTSGSGTAGTKLTGVSSPYPHALRTNGVTYYYVVTATDGQNESGASEQVSATAGHVLLSSVPFADSILRTAVLESGSSYSNQVTSLTCTGAVADLGGIEYLYNLASLHLNSAAVTDLTVLQELPALAEAYIESNALSDISPLATMGSLRYLGLFYTAVEDYAPVGELTNLEGLLIYTSWIADYSFLESLPYLAWLHLESGLTDLTVLSGLTSLSTLQLYSNGITSLTGLETLTNLIDLEMGFNLIADLSPLSGLTNLGWLRLDSNQIVDVSPLASLGSLVYLELADNLITTGVASLVTLTNAGSINFYGAGNSGIPSAHLDTLEAALGDDVVTRPDGG